MYEERKNNLSFKDIFLQLIIVILFVFLMIWLFPTKSYLEDNYVSNDTIKDTIKDELQGMYGRLFTDNLESMRDAAKGYYTNERLPKKVGDSVTLTLDEMLEKKLVLAFKDSNNKACSVDKSYVQVTKMDDEYQMKVQLSCSDYEDYIIVYMGCYDYCNGKMCDKQEKPALPVKPQPKPEVKPTPDPKPEPDPVPVVKEYMYEYRKDVQNTYSEWGPWSEWIKGTMESNQLRNVEIDVRNEIIDYKTEPYTATIRETKYRQEPYQVQVGSRQVSAGLKVTSTKTAYVNRTEGHYTNWTYKGYYNSRHPMRNNNTNRYDYVSQKTTVDCTNVCANVTTYTYKKYSRTYVDGTTTYSCDAGYKLESGICNKYEEQFITEPIYETRTKDVPYVVETNVTKTREVPVYGNVEYYRFRTRIQLTYAHTETEWSKSQNDENLLNNGFILTGNKKEV